MELGFALPHLGPIASRDNIRQVAVEAERLGYHSLWTNERLLKPVNPKTPYPGNPEGVLDWQYETVFEHLTALTYASALTERIRLGVSLINLPFHNPVQLAKRIATMDHLSNGRIDVGLGLGWSEDEADVTNTPFATRGRRGGEYIAGHEGAVGAGPGRVPRRLRRRAAHRVRAEAGAGAAPAAVHGRVRPGRADPRGPDRRRLHRLLRAGRRDPPDAAGRAGRGDRRGPRRRGDADRRALPRAPHRRARCPTRAARSPTGPGSRSTRTASGSTRPASR